MLLEQVNTMARLPFEAENQLVSNYQPGSLGPPDPFPSSNYPLRLKKREVKEEYKKETRQQNSSTSL